MKNERTFYVLELLWIRAYYLGVCCDFSKRLMEHVFGEGARVTKEFGVSKIVHYETCGSYLEAVEKMRSEQLRLELRGEEVFSQLKAAPKEYGPLYARLIKPHLHSLVAPLGGPASGASRGAEPPATTM